MSSTIHKHTPDHLRRVAEFWLRNITASTAQVEESIDGDRCMCCHVEMHAGLAHFVFQGHSINRQVDTRRHRIPVCSDCVAKYAEYDAFCGGTCADCGFPIVDNDGRHNDRGDTICLDCFEANYLKCDDCGGIISKDINCRNAYGSPICEACAEDYCSCDECGEIVRNDGGTWIDSQEAYVCNDCLDTYYSYCNACGGYFRSGQGFDLAHGGAVCDDCYCDGRYCRCDECGGIFHCDDGSSDADGDFWYCESCYNEQADRAIHDYSYEPSWNYHHVKSDGPVLRERFYLGIELEVENKARIKTNNDAAQSCIESAPVVCKTDGSINNGFEVVFHPQTYAYITTEGKPAVENMLSGLRNSGFAGHNYGGMHIHISRQAFTRLHIYKFHRLFCNASRLFAVISQRKTDALNQWASFGNMGYAPDRQTSRYSALNYTSATVEVRIFNSTLRTDRFFKNIEAVKAALNFSKQYGIRDMDAISFVKFIMDNRGVYKNLATFLVEKQKMTLCAAEVDQKVIRQVKKRISHMNG